MIGADSNVLVRFFVEDDPKQADLARQFMQERTIENPVFVSAVVVAELVWALEQIYDYPREQVHASLALLLGSANVVIEREELIKAAVVQARAVNADIVDGIIAALAQLGGAPTTVTFDREAAKRIPGMELLT